MTKPPFYGWYDIRHNNFRLSNYPPDAPVRPSLGFTSKSDAEIYAERKRKKVLWIPELRLDQLVSCYGSSQH